MEGMTVLWNVLWIGAAAAGTAAAIWQYRLRKRNRRVALNTMQAVVNSIDSKSPYKAGHSQRVAQWSVKLASELHYGNPTEVYYAALLHDIGKLEIPEKLLTMNRKPTPEEEKLLHRHPVMGAKLTAGITDFPDVRLAALYHHERCDGKGYPEGLSKENIPMIARIVAAADAYDAMAHERATRGALDRGEILREFREHSEKQFDPKVAKAMAKIIADEACTAEECEIKQKGSKTKA